MFQSLPNAGRVFFKTSAGTVLTSAMSKWGPLVSTDTRFQTPEGDIRNTAIFICKGFSQRRLAARLVDQGHYIYTKTSERYRITGLEDFGSQTTFVGLKQDISQAFVASTAVGIVSEYAFESSAALVTDSQGLNNLTNTNTVTYSSDKPSEIPFNIGSVLFVAASSQRLEISDAAQMQLDVTGNLTICCRVKLTSLPGATPFYVVSKSAGSPDLGFHFNVNTSGKLALGISADGLSGIDAGGATILTTGVWYSFGCVYDGVDIRLYLNGSLDSNGSSNPKAYTSGIFNNAAKFLLSGRDDATRYFDGRLAHVLICNQAKTAAQIAAWHSTDVLA